MDATVPRKMWLAIETAERREMLSLHLCVSFSMESSSPETAEKTEKVHGHRWLIKKRPDKQEDNAKKTKDGGEERGQTNRRPPG
jgi:hypothetical protein